MNGAGVASSTSVGLPAWSRTICPPGGSGGVEIGDRREALLGELRAGQAAYDGHPLARWRALRLLAQHPQARAQRRYPVPAQLKQVVHASADEVDVRVVESGDHAMPERVDHGRTRPDQSSNVALIAHGG